MLDTCDQTGREPCQAHTQVEPTDFYIFKKTKLFNYIVQTVVNLSKQIHCKQYVVRVWIVFRVAQYTYNRNVNPSHCTTFLFIYSLNVEHTPNLDQFLGQLKGVPSL